MIGVVQIVKWGPGKFCSTCFVIRTSFYRRWIIWRSCLNSHVRTGLVRVTILHLPVKAKLFQQYEERNKRISEMVLQWCNILVSCIPLLIFWKSKTLMIFVCIICCSDFSQLKCIVEDIWGAILEYFVYSKRGMSEKILCHLSKIHIEILLIAMIILHMEVAK